MSNKSFFDNLVDTQSNTSITENGALGYKTTKHALLDFLFKLSSYRNSDCISDFNEILKEGDEVSLRNLLKFLFYIRDVREGLGERNTFRKCIHELLKCDKIINKDECVQSILELLPEYGRFDDYYVFVDTLYEKKMFNYLKQIMLNDIKDFKANGLW